MPSISAKPRMRTKQAERLVVFVVYPGIKLLDFSGPYQVFADAPLTKTGQPNYKISVVSLDGGAVKTDTGFEIETEPLAHLARKAIDTLLVVGGMGAIEAARNRRLTQAIGKLSQKARRIGSICTGAFLLAAAGILSGKRAATHWKLCGQLSEQYPKINVERDPIFVNDDGVWTSAGVTAGIDQALAMVSEDLGRPAALALARDLVSYMVRPGGQSQFSDILSAQISDARGGFDALHHWITQNIAGDLHVENLASFMNMSPRTFARTYVKEIGQTPAKMVAAIRLDAARTMLENSRHSISVIADECGFGDIERLRRAFQKRFSISPAEYKKRFNVSE